MMTSGRSVAMVSWIVQRSSTFWRIGRPSHLVWVKLVVRIRRAVWNVRSTNRRMRGQTTDQNRRLRTARNLLTGCPAIGRPACGEVIITASTGLRDASTSPE